LVGPATKSFDDIAKVVGEDCDRNSTGWKNGGIENWAPRAYVESFLTILRPLPPRV
jgi:hypothetical protein